MAPESTNLNDGEKQKSLEKEVKELISTLTNRLGSIQRSKKPGGPSTQNQEEEDDDEQGVRIITLAGSNLGATMHGEMDETKTGDPQGPEQEDFATYVNSNFQAINNSIMFGGSYTTNDPGVHLDISDYVQQDDIHKNGNKVRKNKRGTNKPDHLIQHSEKASDAETN